MNLDLIRRLERQAHDKVWNADVNSEDFPNSFNVEFAELIIRECAKILLESRYKVADSDYYEGFNEALVYSAYALEERFGVEEDV